MYPMISRRIYIKKIKSCKPFWREHIVSIVLQVKTHPARLDGWSKWAVLWGAGPRAVTPLWRHKDMWVQTACLEAQFLNMGCVNFLMDWSFGTHRIHKAHRSALQSHFIQHETFNHCEMYWWPVERPRTGAGRMNSYAEVATSRIPDLWLYICVAFKGAIRCLSVTLLP